MVNVNLLPTEFDAVKQSIIEEFRNNPKSFFKEYFANYTEGGMLSNVVDLFAYITTYYNYMTSVSANEPFLATAQLEKNVYGSAKSLGFIPHRVVASRCEIRFTLKDTFTSKYNPKLTEEIVVPIYTYFRSQQGKGFTLTEEVKFVYDTETSTWRTYEIEDGNTYLDCAEDEILTSTIPNVYYRPIYFTIKQGYFEGKVYRPDGTANQYFTIDRTDVDDSRDSILIVNLKDNKRWEEITNLLDFSLFTTNYNNTYDNLSSYASSEIWINNTLENGIQITFGDNIFGKIPESTDILSVRYFITDGAEGNGHKGFTTASLFSYEKADSSTAEWNGSFLISTIDSINFPNGSSGGTDKQTTDSIRSVAPLAFSAQDRIVVDADYETHIRKQNFINVQDVKIVSGESYYPPFLGGVAVIVAKQVADLSSPIHTIFLTPQEKETLKQYIQSKCVTGNDSVLFADPEVVYVFLTGKVFYKPILYTLGDVQTVFGGIVESYFETLSDFNSYYKHSRLMGAFTSTREIDHVNLSHSFYFIKKCDSEMLEDDVIVNLNNSILQGSITSNFSVDLNLDENLPYVLVIENPAELEITDPSYKDYFYSIYDADGDMILKEDVKDIDGVVLSTHESVIGSIKYNTGIMRLSFSSYEFMSNVEQFEIFNAGSGGTYCFNTLLDVLTNNNAVIGDDPVAFYLKFSFRTKVTESFKSSGTQIIRYLDPVVQYVGEK